MNFWQECETDRECSSSVKARSKIGPKLHRFVLLERRRPINSVDELRHLQQVIATTTCAVLARPGKRVHWIISERQKAAVLQDAGIRFGHRLRGRTSEKLRPPSKHLWPLLGAPQALQIAPLSARHHPYMPPPRVHRSRLAAEPNLNEPPADPDLAICTVK
jgi:hypothetical protein